MKINNNLIMESLENLVNNKQSKDNNLYQMKNLILVISKILDFKMTNNKYNNYKINKNKHKNQQYSNNKRNKNKSKFNRLNNNKI